MPKQKTHGNNQRAHPHPIRLYFAREDAAWLPSLRGRELGNGTAARRALALPLPRGSPERAAGAALGGARQGRARAEAGTGARPSLLDTYARSSRGPSPLAPGSPAAGALPRVAVPGKRPRPPRGEGTRPLTAQDAQVTEEQQAEAATRHLLGDGRSPPAAAANSRRGVRRGAAGSGLALPCPGGTGRRLRAGAAGEGGRGAGAVAGAQRARPAGLCLCAGGASSHRYRQPASSTPKLLTCARRRSTAPCWLRAPVAAAGRRAVLRPAARPSPGRPGRGAAEGSSSAPAPGSPLSSASSSASAVTSRIPELYRITLSSSSLRFMYLFLHCEIFISSRTFVATE